MVLERTNKTKKSTVGCNEARLLFGHLWTSGASGATGQNKAWKFFEPCRVSFEHFKDQSSKGVQEWWFMDISGAMLNTQKETSWIQEGWINMVDLEHHEVRGYFFLPANRDVGINGTTELIVEGVRMYVTLVMSSMTFHPQILKYRFIATGQVASLKEKLIPDPNLTMTQSYFLETDFSSRLNRAGFWDAQKQSEKQNPVQSFFNPIESFIHTRAAMFERLLHTEFAKPKLNC
jgi:hypothetical protein